MNVKTKDFVIVECTADTLLKDTQLSGSGWTGGGHNYLNAYHLGVYSATNAEVRRGTITMRNGRAGWGFGHRAFIDDVQGYGWANQPIERTAFEIAVKTAPLSADERKRLLEK